MTYTLPNMLMGMLVGGPKRCSNSAILAVLVALSDMSVTRSDVNNVFCVVMAVHLSLSVPHCDVNNVFCDVNNVFCDVNNVFCDVNNVFCDVMAEHLSS
jgi:hypothetical protein